MKTGYKMVASGMLGGSVVAVAAVIINIWGPFSSKHQSAPKPTEPVVKNTTTSPVSNVIIKLVPTKPGNMQKQKQVYTAVQQALADPSSVSLDASGFVQYIFGKAGVQLPRTIAEQAQVGTMIARSQLETGDLVFYNLYGQNGTATFDGIYIGNQQFAAVTSHGLMTVNMNDSYWSNKFLYGRRVL
ncbi:hypothetical protein N007_13730 [Alicyclobacillus acidoterrestris ATCC 49025]|nr:hypothetical protein N007_13730 [Alicyclobacillus acidoterrestris ATCC 49025]